MKNNDIWIVAQLGKHADTGFSDKFNNIDKSDVLNITTKMSVLFT